MCFLVQLCDVIILKTGNGEPSYFMPVISNNCVVAVMYRSWQMNLVCQMEPK